MSYEMKRMQVKAYSVDDETIDAIREHAERNRAPLSWALRDLVRRGVGVVRLELSLRELRDELQREEMEP
jgi:hypothetical protein